MDESLTTLKYATRFSQCTQIPSFQMSHSDMMIATLKRENKILKQEIRLLKDLTGSASGLKRSHNDR